MGDFDNSDFGNSDFGNSDFGNSDFGMAVTFPVGAGLSRVEADMKYIGVL